MYEEWILNINIAVNYSHLIVESQNHGQYAQFDANDKLKVFISVNYVQI